MATIFFLPNLNSAQVSDGRYSLREVDGHFFDLIAPQRFNEFRRKANKEAALVLGNDKSLADVTAADKFYVFGHGDYRDGSLHCKMEGTHKIGMFGVARLLKLRGLPNALDLVVRLFACTSAVTNGHGNKSMAQQLAINLGTAGYTNLTVKGYTGFVNLGDGHHLKVTKDYNADNGHLGDLLDAKDNCVRYDMTGGILAGHEAVGRRVTTPFHRHTKFRIR